MQTLGLRPYKREDADTILSWSTDEKGFYQWSAGIMGKYPIAREEFSFVDSLMAFTAFDENGIVGFFTLRNPEGKTDELRIGFVIIDPKRRGSGTGKGMLLLALRYAFDIYGATWEYSKTISRPIIAIKQPDSEMENLTGLRLILSWEKYGKAGKCS